MPRPHRTPDFTIDARPRGPDGPLAVAPLMGRPVLAHLVELAAGLGANGPVAVYARADEHERLGRLIAEAGGPPVALATGPPPEQTLILRTDRLYDPARLRRAVRSGKGPESAVVWRLDGPHTFAGAEAELLRRRCYQPIGRYWAVPIASGLVGLLARSRVRPHALTVGSFVLMLTAAGFVLSGDRWPWARWATAGALAGALVLDATDGRLARRQGTASPVGRWLDTTLDETGEMAMHGAVSWSAFAATGAAAWLVVGMVYGMGKYLFTISNDEWNRATRPADRPAGPPLDAEPRPASPSWWLRKLGHADVRWHLWIAAAALGRLEWALAGYAAYFPIRAVAGAVRKVSSHD